MRQSRHGTVSSLPSAGSISKGTGGKRRRGVTRFRSAEKIKEEAGRESERGPREALFCLGEETRPERRARKLSSVCLLSRRVTPCPHLPPPFARPTTCHRLSYIFVVRAPFLFAPASTKYEGRFAGVLRVKTRYIVLAAHLRRLLRRFYTDSAFPSPPFLPQRAPSSLSKGCRVEECI